MPVVVLGEVDCLQNFISLPRLQVGLCPIRPTLVVCMLVCLCACVPPRQMPTRAARSPRTQELHDWAGPSASGCM